MTSHDSEPTYENQLKAAQQLLKDKGPDELLRHARIGRMCGCRNCFCCAAEQTLREYVETEGQ